MNATGAETNPVNYGASVMSDEERIAIMADIILEAISAEEAQSVETEG